MDVPRRAGYVHVRPSLSAEWIGVQTLIDENAEIVV